MKEVNVRIEPAGLEGVVAVGTNLRSLLGRFGKYKERQCDIAKGLHNCSVTIALGSELLSPLTEIETEHFLEIRRKESERLACEAAVVGEGEIVVMTAQEKQENTDSPKKDKFVEEFSALPLEKKLATLFKMEAVALGETFEFVLNSPFKVAEKVGDVMAEFGMKLEEAAKKKAPNAKKAPDSKADAPRKPRAAPKKRSSTRKTEGKD